MKFTCAVCGETHDSAEVGFGAVAPAQWELLTAQEREASVLGGEDCLIETSEGASFYLRGVLELPLADGEVWTWGVWCSLSEPSMADIYECWDDPARSERGPYFGWLCTALPFYPDTMFMAVRIHLRPPGERPWVELEPTAHPLAFEQRDGLDPQRAAWMTGQLLHPA